MISLIIPPKVLFPSIYLICLAVENICADHCELVSGPNLPCFGDVDAGIWHRLKH